MFKLMVLSLFVANAWVAAASDDKVIYGNDDRVFVHESKNELYKQLASSTAAMISTSSIEYKFDNMLVEIKGKALKDSMRVCEEQRFAQTTTSAICSGFLVGDDLLVTAGHCAQSEISCKNYKWVFDFRKDVSTDAKTTFVSPENVYSCKKIINQVLDENTQNDFAVIQLDRKVVGRTPLKYRTEGKVDDSTELVVIGHPSGLPSIVADGAKVRTNDNAWFFSANLDTFQGNSGSAVFDAQTGLLEGILVRGEKDYNYNSEKRCFEVYNCENDKCRGEDVTRITVIPELVPGMTPVAPALTSESLEEDLLANL